MAALMDFEKVDTPEVENGGSLFDPDNNDIEMSTLTSKVNILQLLHFKQITFSFCCFLFHSLSYDLVPEHEPGLFYISLFILLIFSSLKFFTQKHFTTHTPDVDICSSALDSGTIPHLFD